MISYLILFKYAIDENGNKAILVPCQYCEIDTNCVIFYEDEELSEPRLIVSLSEIVYVKSVERE